MVATIKSYRYRFTDVPKSEVRQLVAAISEGPVSVAVEADQAGWQHYASGIFSGPCDQPLDHGVLAIGFTDKCTSPPRARAPPPWGSGTRWVPAPWEMSRGVHPSECSVQSVGPQSRAVAAG